MDVLMAIVIGFILVVAGYVGYYASQEEPKAVLENFPEGSPATPLYNIQTPSCS